MKIFIIMIAFLSTQAAFARADKCVNIFFDRSEDSSYWMGRTYSIFLQNLLGHFPQFQQIVSPIELYQKGDTEKCQATFYIASYFNNKIPEAFLQDYIATKRQVAWMGYSTWQLKNTLPETFGFQYGGLTKLSEAVTDANGMPTYFKWVDYKGERFFKFGDWSKDEPKKFSAPFEQTILVETAPGKSEVLAWSINNGTNEKIPYAVRAKNRFYIADIPFSFMHEADRYLIFSDLLFDILQVEPSRKEKLALVRIEDVHPLSPLSSIYNIASALETEAIPANISLIPIFFDPLKRYDRPNEKEFVTMERKPEFMDYIRNQEKKGASFIWHGVTHQYNQEKNPHTGISGEDFEFWDANQNTPVKEDSHLWLLNRLDDGFSVLRAAKVEDPIIWLTPHYQASALDYMIFARVFPWNMGRVIYFNVYPGALPKINNERRLWLSNNSPEANSFRENYFKKIQITQTSNRWNGQFFPYEIYGDIYGQRLLPENLGNSQPYISNHVPKTRTVQQIIQDAKRNLVIRDAWASFFYHPFLLQKYENGGRGAYPGDPEELLYLIREIKKLGYRFVNANEFARQNIKAIRKEPIYREIE